MIFTVYISLKKCNHATAIYKLETKMPSNATCPNNWMYQWEEYAYIHIPHMVSLTSTMWPVALYTDNNTNNNANDNEV